MNVNQNSAATSTQAAGTTGTSAARNKLSGTYDNFLKMLTTQLQYQDPMQPMDSAQFTNQLVLYSQVEQQISQNEKLDKLVKLQNLNQTQTSLSFIGLDVEIDGKEFEKTGDKSSFSYTLPENADSAKVRILDSSGKLVQEIKAETRAGRHEITWDGKTLNDTVAPNGIYSIEVAATSRGKDKKPLDVDTTIFGRVSGIESGNGDTTLLMGELPVKMDKVISARKPTTAAAS